MLISRNLVASLMAADGDPGAAVTKARNLSSPAESGTAISTLQLMTVPYCVFRDPHQRTSRHCNRVLETSRSLVHLDRDHTPTGDHRQRLVLPLRVVAPRMRRNRHHSEKDSTVSAPIQRESGTVPPYLVRGNGLHPALGIRQPTHPRLQRVHPLL